MSFRFSKIPRSRGRSCQTQVVKDIVKTFIVDDGVEKVSFVAVDNSEVTSKIPSADEYSLQNLLRAGVPIKQVNAAVLDFVPSEAQINNIVEHLPGLGDNKNDE